MTTNEIFESDASEYGWLKVGTRLPVGIGPMPSSGEILRPLTDADRARVVEILNKLQVVDDPDIAPIDG